MGYGRASMDSVLAELHIYSIPFFRVSHIELIISLQYLVLGKKFLRSQLWLFIRKIRLFYFQLWKPIKKISAEFRRRIKIRKVTNSLFHKHFAMKKQSCNICSTKKKITELYAFWPDSLSIKFICIGLLSWNKKHLGVFFLQVFRSIRKRESAAHHQLPCFPELCFLDKRDSHPSSSPIFLSSLKAWWPENKKK